MNKMLEWPYKIINGLMDNTTYTYTASINKLHFGENVEKCSSSGKFTNEELIPVLLAKSWIDSLKLTVICSHLSSFSSIESVTPIA